MAFEVDFTDEFEAWWDGLSIAEQDAVRNGDNLLIERGPALGRPQVDTLKGSEFTNMKELRVQPA